MLKTVAVGSCVSVQGIHIRTLTNGKVVVKVGEKLFAGTPVAKAA